jgi:flagellar biosynthesis/type III secretory pathway chaperone
MDISKQVNELIDITTRLIDLLTKENKALREHDTVEATALLSEKNSLSEVYEEHVEAVMNHSEHLNALEPKLKETLSSIGEKAKTLIEENAILLRASIVANQRVMEMVANALSSARKKVTTYSADGTLGTTPHRDSIQTPALSVDHSL